MKRRIYSAIAFAIVSMVICLEPVMAEPFAPKAEIPDALLKANNFEALMTKNCTVPDREEVGVPAYPGAKVLFAQPAQDVKMNGKAMKSMARVVLGTTDNLDDVVAYYKNRLSDRHFTDFYGTAYFSGTPEFKPISEEAMTTPHLLVRKQLKTAPNEVMPEASAIIEVLYYPPH